MTGRGTSTSLLRPRAVVPPAGPVWFGAVMGTGILATLLRRAGAPTLLPAALLVVGWVLVVGLVTTYALRLHRGETSLRESTVTIGDVTAWGLVSMGFLSVGSATLAVLGPQAVPVSLVLWVLASALGSWTAVTFVPRARRAGELPTFTWGLPVVPPMVTATTGAGLSARLTGPTEWVVLSVSLAGFWLSIVAGGWIFARAYLRHLGDPLPLAASTSAWIPLGVVGQSTAAAQLLAEGVGRHLDEGSAGVVRTLAVDYGRFALVLGIPLALLAVRATVRGLARRMPWSPGWWALTFPLGTLALGAGTLGRASASDALVSVGMALTLVLAGTWTFCAVTTVAVLRYRRGREAAHLRRRTTYPSRSHVIS